MSVVILNGEIQKRKIPASILISDIVEHSAEDHIPDGHESTPTVVRGLLDSAMQMDRICSILRHATEHLRLGNESHFRPLFVAAIEELVSFLHFLTWSRSSVGDNGSALDHLYLRIKEQIEQLFQAYQRRDLVLLTDMIEYELTPLFEGWQGVCNALLKSLSKEALPASMTS